MHYLLPDGTITTTQTDNCPISYDGGNTFVMFAKTTDAEGNPIILPNYTANFNGNIRWNSTDMSSDYETRDGGAHWSSR